MARIHLIDGEKGGVGKSLFVRVMVQYAIDKKLEHTLVDSDTTNQDVKRFYDYAVNAEFSEAVNKGDRADIIFELARKTPVIVNLPANIFPRVNNWISRGKLLEVADKYGVDICKWFVCDGGFESIDLFYQSINLYKDKMLHVFVRNLGKTDDWSFLNDDTTYKDITNKFKNTLKIIDFPLLYPGDRYFIDSKKLRFDASEIEETMPIISQQRLSTFLEESHQEIENTQLWIKEKQPKKKDVVKS
ncbi:mobilization protein MobD-like protein [Brunnivagina elsteri]|uniref:Mobilization protein MobD-like protein n=1 Tax=Brunnivagina elsteri CCALA 953 TaxID=987040 RepID=A0A2A2TEZ8_9CYAN|nr:mobilization protein MobD-like protein [Calothrix elsteri]PAX52246.1 mobilization protein MobD-like protein [Calothrix elsteri CCALA 953]